MLGSQRDGEVSAEAIRDGRIKGRRGGKTGRPSEKKGVGRTRGREKGENGGGIEPSRMTRWQKDRRRREEIRGDRAKEKNDRGLGGKTGRQDWEREGRDREIGRLIHLESGSRASKTI